MDREEFIAFWTSNCDACDPCLHNEKFSADLDSLLASAHEEARKDAYGQAADWVDGLDSLSAGHIRAKARALGLPVPSPAPSPAKQVRERLGFSPVTPEQRDENLDRNLALLPGVVSTTRCAHGHKAAIGCPICHGTGKETTVSTCQGCCGSGKGGGE